MRRLVLIALFLEVGFLLLVIPWSSFWDQNYFGQALPAVHRIMINNYVRGAISGLGLVNVYLGLAELITAITSRSAPPSSPFGASSIQSRE